MTRIPHRLKQELPVVLEADVIVAGGGPGGLGAAVLAARAGARTALIERYGFLGGMAASGEVHPFMPNHARGVCLDKPVYTEWVARIHSYLPPRLREKIGGQGEAVSHEERSISKDAAMLAAEDLCLEAGVQLLYHHTLCDVGTDGRRVAYLVLASKSGLTAARAKQYVDCTGDGDLAAFAGCEFEHGGPQGHGQPMTLCFKLSHVERARMPGREELKKLYAAAKESGEIHCRREDVLHFAYYDEDVIHFNTTRVILKDGTDARQLSEAEIEGRRQMREYLTWLRRRVPGFEEARIHSLAHHIGVRESRRVKGLAYLRREAFEGRAKFADAIARVRYSIDIHNPLGTGTEHAHLPEGEYYEIPYGCVVAKDCDNLTVGGRPISVDHAIHSSMRVMPPACSVGQAAGLAAALAARRGILPAELDGLEVRRLLRGRGANL
jgi:glycine/D-amino acid oxidase-like deaminating enzyme